MMKTRPLSTAFFIKVFFIKVCPKYIISPFVINAYIACVNPVCDVSFSLTLAKRYMNASASFTAKH